MRDGRGVLGAGLVLALGLHVGLSQVMTARPEGKVAKPLTTQFIKRQPRLTKPLEMKKEPLPKRRRMKRTMVTVRPEASAARASARAGPPELVPILASPGVTVSRMGYAAGAAMEPEVAAQAMGVSLEDESVVDMSLELLDVEALDTGRYCAMVIEDPADKRNIRGFLHLAVVYPTSLPEWDKEHLMNPRAVRGLAALAAAMNEYTGMRTDVRGAFCFNSSRIFQTPWVHVRYGIWPGYTTDGELEALGRYALCGGFVFVDGYGVPGNPVEYCYDEHQWAIEQALALNGLHRGRHWDFERIDASHAVFHCFFDFEGPPVGWVPPPSSGEEPREIPLADIVTREGRVVVMFSHKGWCRAWCGERIRGSQSLFYSRDNTRQLQYGVNLLVFALTQEGGLTKRLMGGFRGY